MREKIFLIVSFGLVAASLYYREIWQSRLHLKPFAMSTLKAVSGFLFAETHTRTEDGRIIRLDERR